MVIASPSSLSSSSSSSVCSDDASVKRSVAGVVKFLCSYGGRILPRYPDGKLRYVGGETRVLAVDRSVPFQELQAKLGELSGYGSGVSLRFQLPTEDLDALVTITSDEDLANLIEEYDLATRDKSSPMKVRAFLSAPPPPSKPPKPSSPPRQGGVCGGFYPRPPVNAAAGRCFNQIPGPTRFPGSRREGSPPLAGYHRIYGGQHGCVPRGSPSSHQFLVHHGYHWQ